MGIDGGAARGGFGFPLALNIRGGWCLCVKRGRFDEGVGQGNK